MLLPRTVCGATIVHDCSSSRGRSRYWCWILSWLVAGLLSEETLNQPVRLTILLPAPRHVLACRARCETSCALATRAAALTKLPGRSFPQRCRCDVFLSDVMLYELFPWGALKMSKHEFVFCVMCALFLFWETSSARTTTYIVASGTTLIESLPFILDLRLTGSLGGSSRHIGTAGGAGQGQLGTTHLKGG